jgi:hypothetical protein
MKPVLYGEDTYKMLEAQIAEKDEEIEMIEASYSGLQYEMEKALKEKDKRIDILRAEHDYLMDGSRELKAELDEKDQIIRDMAWLAYMDQVVDTQSEMDLIGPDNEYADKEDWIESYIKGLKCDATQDRIQACH